MYCRLIEGTPATTSGKDITVEYLTRDIVGQAVGGQGLFVC